MKSLTRVFAAFLLAITIAFSGFSGSAHAAPFPVPNISIDVNTTIDQILGFVKTNEDFQIVVSNQTPYPLNRVATWNDTSNWPIFDVPPFTALQEDWKENGLGSFSFASNYAVGNTGKYFQFAASWPLIGTRKIHICASNDSSQAAAKKCWNAISDSNDKTILNAPFIGKAQMGKKNGKIQWVYQVK